jgi:hypothetical protein
MAAQNALRRLTIGLSRLNWSFVRTLARETVAVIARFRVGAILVFNTRHIFVKQLIIKVEEGSSNNRPSYSHAENAWKYS